MDFKYRVGQLSKRRGETSGSHPRMSEDSFEALTRTAQTRNPRTTLVRFSKILLFRVRSDVRVQLFGPWIPDTDFV